MEFLKMMGPMIKFLESKLGRIAVIVGLVSLVAEIVLDSLDAENAMRVSEFGCLGTILAFGIGLLCILPNDNDTPPHMRRRWYLLAVLWTVGGGLTLLLILCNLIHVISVAIF